MGEKEKREERTFISKYENALEEITPLYSNWDIAYQQEYSGPYEDVSYYGDDAIVIAGLKDGHISGFGRSMIALGRPKSLKREIQRLYSISNHILYLDYLKEGTASAVTKFLLAKGVTAKPYFSQVIDLTSDRLYTDLRKSYKQLVKQDDDVIASSDGRHLDKLRELHKQICGYSTRPQATWDIQKKMLIKRRAFVVSKMDGDKMLAGALFYHNKYSAYYAVAKSLPEVKTHSLIWKAIQYAKWMGLQTLEMGEQVFNGDKKTVDISLFKSGFGGQTKTRLLIDD
jgi:hypothetical protein